jgi:hypothetical protein
MKNSATKNQTPLSPLSAEFMQDAWDRFERAVNVVSKSGPKHKRAKPDSTNRFMAASLPDEDRGNGEICDKEGSRQKDSAKNGQKGRK